MTTSAVDLGYAARRQAIVFYRSQDDRNSVFNSHTEFSNLNMVHRDLINVLPVSVLFDCAMAFPSVSHAWIFLFSTS